MARPRSEDEPLDETFSFKLTKTDKRMFEGLIAQSRRNRSEFFRLVIGAALQKKLIVVAPALRGERESIKPPKPQSAHDAKLLFLLAQLSNNVNQIAHRLNADHKAGIVKPGTYESILSELSILADKAKALGVK